MIEESWLWLTLRGWLEWVVIGWEEMAALLREEATEVVSALDIMMTVAMQGGGGHKTQGLAHFCGRDGEGKKGEERGAGVQIVGVCALMSMTHNKQTCLDMGNKCLAMPAMHKESPAGPFRWWQGSTGDTGLGRRMCTKSCRCGTAMRCSVIENTIDRMH